MINAVAQRASFWAVLAVAWFATMGWRPLLEPDEGRYAEIPREMAISGDWVTPRLNGILYFEKPALQYWATAAAYKVFGFGEWTARLWSCGLAFGCIPLVYWFAWQLYGAPNAARAAATALSMNPYFAVVGQLDLLDCALAFFLSAAIFSYLRAGASAPSSVSERRWMLTSAVTLALAVLSKGVVAPVLLGATLAIHMLVTGQIRPLPRWHLRVTLPVFLIIAVPWFVWVSARNPGFARFFFVHEHVARYFTNVSERVKPWWFFLPLVFVAALPWVGAVLASVRTLATSTWREPQCSSRWFLWIWCGVILVFFSISHSKLATYILPMMPALAILLAPHIAEQPRRIYHAAWVMTGWVALIGCGFACKALRTSPATCDAVLGYSGAALVIAILGIVFASRSAVAAAATSILAFQALIVSYALLPPLPTAKPLVAMVRRLVGPHTVLFSVDQYRQSVAPYLGRTQQLVRYQGELQFGITQEPDRFTATLKGFEQEWRRLSDAVAFVDRDTLPMLEADELPMRIVARDDQTIVLARH